MRCSDLSLVSSLKNGSGLAYCHSLQAGPAGAHRHSVFCEQESRNLAENLDGGAKWHWDARFRKKLCTAVHESSSGAVRRCVACAALGLYRSALYLALAAACSMYILRWTASWTGVQGPQRPAVAA